MPFLQSRRLSFFLICVHTYRHSIQASVKVGLKPAPFAAAVAVGFLIFRAAIKIKLKHFFAVTNVVLILLAAGLVARGIHVRSRGIWRV